MVYEYECKKHGVFTATKPLKEYKKPAKCPKCNEECDRVLATAFPKSQSWQV